MKHLVDVACEEPHEDLTRFASYQHFIWAHDAGEKGKGMYHYAPLIATESLLVPLYLSTALQTGWLASLWDARCNQAVSDCTLASVYFLQQSHPQDTLEGPDVLLCPTLLQVSAELKYTNFLFFSSCAHPPHSQARNVSLSSVKGHEASIRRHLRLLSMQCIVHESRVQQLSAFMCQTTLSVSEASIVMKISF